MILARVSREHGANIAKVVEKIAPDNFTTTCYTLKIVLYKYDGDVTKWPHMKLQYYKCLNIVYCSILQ